MRPVIRVFAVMVVLAGVAALVGMVRVSGKDSSRPVDPGWNLISVAGTYTEPVPVPVAPSNLTAAAVSESRIDLSWTDNSTDEISFYLQRSITADFTNITLGVNVGANVTVYSDTGLTSGSTYYYRVSACNEGGCSAYSNISSATTLAPAVPAAPSNLTAIGVTESQIDLAWQDNSTNETAFSIEQSTDGGTNFSILANVGSDVMMYSITGLTPGATYYHRIRASNSAGYSGYSNTVITIMSDTPPSAPTGLAAFVTKIKSRYQVRLSWNVNSENDLMGYKVYRSLTSGSGYNLISTVSSNSFTDTNVNRGVTYYYVVRAYDGGGYESESSSEVSATPGQ